MRIRLQKTAQEGEFFLGKRAFPYLHVVRGKLEAHRIEAVFAWPLKMNEDPTALLAVKQLGMHDLGAIAQGEIGIHHGGLLPT